MKKKSNNKPLVSVIILTYKDGLEDVKKCLDSLLKLSYPKLEVVLVDNASTDNTVEYVKKNFPKVILVECKKNLGFCGGNNVGLKKTHGKYILFLNNDAIVVSNFLSILVNTLEDDKTIGVVQPKIRQLKNKNKLDACASFFTNTGFLYHYGYSQNQADQKYNQPLLVYSVKGACFLVRKKLIDRIGLFDDDYFAYFEETDFCHRVWLTGFTVNYIPTAEIFHLGGAGKSASSFIQFHSYKNRIQTYIKNLDTKNLLTILPVHIIICLAIATSYLVQGNISYFFAIINAILWNLFNLNATIQKRKYVQKKIRKVKDSDLLPIIKKSARVSYYKHFLLSPRSFYAFDEINN